MKDSRAGAAMSAAPIYVEDLVKSYRGKRGKRVDALKGVSFSIRKGEVFGFLGPNGAGKSTTIKTIMGLIRPTSGSVLLGGRDVRDSTARAAVGYLPENPSFYDFLSGREYLRFVADAFNMGRGVGPRIDQVLSWLSLSEAADRPLRGYSKGMVQRLGLAQALLHDPEVLILDEPMSGLDPLGRALVKDLILELKGKGKTIFFSTHVTADVEQVCDRIGVIVAGVYQEERVVSELMREGINGYFCRVRGGDAAVFAAKDVKDLGSGFSELFVSREEFDTFAAKLLKSGGSFDLIEPRRRDVEEYFLKLVRSSGAASCA